MAMLAQKIGRQIFLVVEKYTELGADPAARRASRRAAEHRHAREAGRPRGGPLAGLGRLPLEVRPLGDRNSAGPRRAARRCGMADCFKLLHFHLGSQITNIRHIKAALNEAARIYVDLVRHGAGLEYLDVGGGLGVDYDGSQTNFESSVNYTLQEYANDVVYHVKSVCDEAGVAAPDDLLRERPGGGGLSQRAGLQRAGRLRPQRQRRARQAARGRRAAAARPAGHLPAISCRNLLESYHDAQQALDMTMHLFSGGYLPLEQRSLAGEPLLGDLPQDPEAARGRWTTCPRSWKGWTRCLSETYFCNFSLFQSMPDSWAIKQLFPIMPIHRLERAARAPRRCWATSPAIPTARSSVSSTAAT